MEDEEHDGAAEEHETDCQNPKRRRADEVEVEPPQKVELKEPDKLRCPNCKVLYPIVDGIPVMLIEEGKPEAEKA